MEIAKLRALRMLWSRAVSAAGGKGPRNKLPLHVAHLALEQDGVTIPTTICCGAQWKPLPACSGGCDSMQVGAFDEVVRRPDDFSQRLARNTQLILQKECQLDHVIDPVGGSWFVESVTAELAGKAWALFQEVEKLGGMAAALQAGFPQKTVAATAAKRSKRCNRRRDSIVGVNQYAN